MSRFQRFSLDVDGAARAKESAVGRGRGVAPTEPTLGTTGPAPALCGTAGDRARCELSPRRPAAVGRALVLGAHLWSTIISK